MTKFTKVVSQETGEIGTLVPDTGEYVIMHRNSLFANNKNLTDQKKGANHPFFFVCLDSFSQLSHIKDKYLGYFLMLCSYIDYSNRITYGQKKIPASKRQLLYILNINSNTLNDFLTAAFAEELIYMDTTYDAYIVNPKIIYRGEMQDKNSVKIYSHPTRQVYRDTCAKDLGFLLKLYPFINRYTNVICSNPHESNTVLIKVVNKSDLAKLLNISRVTLDKKLDTLKSNNYFMLREQAFNTCKAIYTNPLFYCKQKNYPDKITLLNFEV